MYPATIRLTVYLSNYVNQPYINLNIYLPILAMHQREGCIRIKAGKKHNAEDIRRKKIKWIESEIDGRKRK